MDNLTICKNIAEIEQITGHEYMGAFVPSGRYNMAVNDSKDNVYSYSIDDYSYNPLTDDALCFALMVKYKVLITWNPSLNDNCHAIIDGNSEDIPFDFAIADISDINPNKAILLAIIEAHKD